MISTTTIFTPLFQIEYETFLTFDHQLLKNKYVNEILINFHSFKNHRTCGRSQHHIMKKINQKLFNVDTFSIFLKKQITGISTDEAHINERIKYMDVMLEKEDPKLTGKAFFVITHALGLDLTDTCHQFFKDSPAIQLKSSNNDVEKLFGIFFNTKENLSSATGLSETSIHRLLNKSFDLLYANEVYALALAFGMAPNLLFEYCYGDQKKKFVIKFELIDADIMDHEHEIEVDDQEISNITVATGTEKMTSTIKKDQNTTFDYIVKETDYFLTPRTPKEIVQDFKTMYDFYINPSNIYTYLNKYTNNELTKIKVNEFTAHGTISKKPKVSFIKTTQQPAKHNQLKKQSISPIRKKVSEKRSVMEEKEETCAVNKLYDYIVDNPGKRPDLFLSAFDIKARVLERRLQKLQNKAKIEYRGKGKSGGYWPVSTSN